MKKVDGYTIIESTNEIDSFCNNNNYSFEDCIFNIELNFTGKTISSFHSIRCIFNERVDFSNATVGGTYFIILGAQFEKIVLFKNISFIGTNCFVNIAGNIKSRFLFNDIVKPCDNIILFLTGSQRNLNVDLSNSQFKNSVSLVLKDRSNNNSENFFRVILDNTNVNGSASISSEANTTLQLSNFFVKSSLSLRGKFLGIWFNGTIIGQTLLLYEFELLSGKREDYNFLKSNLLKSNNRIDALTYSRLEMKAYFNNMLPNMTLSPKLKSISKTIKTWRTNIYSFFSRIFLFKGDFWILFFSGLSNKHGTSWSRGVVFTVFIALFFFIMYNLNLEKPLFELGWNGWQSYWNAVKESFSYYIQFLYIGHDVGFMKNNSPNNLALLFDFLGRIFIGFGYYQTIAAFRKFGKL